MTPRAVNLVHAMALLDAMVIVGAAIAFFIHPPASEAGMLGIVGLFAVIMAIVGILAGSGSILAQLGWMVFLGGLLPGGIELKALAGAWLAAVVFLMPLALSKVLRYSAAGAGPARSFRATRPPSELGDTDAREPHLSAQVRGLLKAGDRLAAIKAYRAETGADYKQAIAVIDTAMHDVQQAV